MAPDTLSPDQSALLLAVAEHLARLRDEQQSQQYQPTSYLSGVLMGLDMAASELRRLARHREP